MRMPVSQIPTVIAEYFDSVLIPAANRAGSLQAFSVGFIGGLVSKNSQQMVNQNLPLMKTLGLVDNENMLNVDLAYEEACKSISKMPVIVGSYTADKADIDQIREIMRKYSV